MNRTPFYQDIAANTFIHVKFQQFFVFYFCFVNQCPPIHAFLKSQMEMPDTDLQILV